jgi:hypothetical protein
MGIRQIALTSALAVVDILLAASLAAAQGAQLDFKGAGGIVCPAANAYVRVYVSNHSGSPQTISRAADMR